MGERSSDIEECVLKALNLYSHKDYKRCVLILQDLKQRLRENHVTKVLSEIFECDENVIYIALESNILTADALVAICEGSLDNQKWYAVMDNLLRQLDILEGVRIAYQVPLLMNLNIVYNTLWWGWSFPDALHQDKSHLKSCIQTAIRVCYRVLEDCKAGLMKSGLGENEDKLFGLMKKLVPHLIHLTGPEAVLALETILLTVHILIEACPTGRTYRKCGDVLENVLGLRHEISELVARSKHKNASLHLFRFDLHERDIAFMMDVTVITCSLCYLLAKSYETSTSLLELKMTSENLNLKYLWNFLTALTYYHMNELEASLLYVKKLEHIPMDEEARTRYLLLHAAVLVKKGLYLEGLNVLLTLRETQQSTHLQAVTLFHISEVYRVLEGIHLHSTSEQTDASGKEKPCFFDVPREGCLNALKQLAYLLRNKDESHRNAGTSYDLQCRILSLVYPKPEVNLALALVLLAERLIHDGETHAASEVYSELLREQDLYAHKSLLRPLPCVSVLYHTAVTLHLRCGSLEQAAEACKRCLQLFWKQENGGDVEANLLRLEQDLVAMILQAHIHRLAGDDKSESNMLDKCLNVIFNFKLKNRTECDHMTDDEARFLELLELLSARLHVQKANIYHNRGFGFETDAVHEVREALYCNPDDKDAMQLYTVLVKEKQLDVSRKTLTAADIDSVALKYILETQITSVNDKDEHNMFQDSDVDLFDEWIIE